MKKFLCLVIFFIEGCGPGPHMPVSPTSSNDSGPISVGDFTNKTNYNRDILPIFQARCAKCHNATSELPNWLNEKVATAAKNDIFLRVWAAKDMPPDKSITEQERAQIAAWAKGKKSTPQTGSLPTSENEEVSIQQNTNGTVQSIETNVSLGRGEYLTRAGDCLSCHTAQAKDSVLAAGGREITTPFGSLVTPNITPDVESGIGSWTPDQFYTAVHEGVSPRGEKYYPAFPYLSYTKMPRTDVDAIFYYLKTLKPAPNKVEVNHLRFPYNIRSTLAPWRLLFFKKGEYQKDPAHDDAWNRGAYLVNGPGHCGACHTPRNFLGAPKSSEFLKGAEVENWNSPDISANSSYGVGKWSILELKRFLKIGSTGQETAIGPMYDVINNSLKYLNDSDIEAIAIYLKTNSDSKYKGYNSDQGKKLYADECSTCHLTDGTGTPNSIPSLVSNSIVSSENPSNLINVVLKGIPARGSYKAMPSFEGKLTTKQLADLVNYVRLTWGAEVKSGVDPESILMSR